jgi:hypothetical protein
MFGTIPLPKICDAWVQRALDFAETLDSQLTRALIYSRAAVYDIYRARWERMHTVIDESIEITERLNDRRAREEALVIGGFGLLFSGELLKADMRLARLADSSRGSGNAQGLAWGNLGRAQCFIRFGRTAEALELCQGVMPWLTTKGLAADKVLGHAISAHARLRLGDLEGALEDADYVARNYIKKRPAAYWVKPAAPAVVDIYAEAVRQGVDTKRSLKRLRQSVKCAKTFGKIFPFGEAAGFYAEGVAEEAQGHSSRAVASWRKAAEVAEARGSILELGLAHKQLGDKLAADDPQRPISSELGMQTLMRIGAGAEMSR